MDVVGWGRKSLRCIGGCWRRCSFRKGGFRGRRVGLLGRLGLVDGLVRLLEDGFGRALLEKNVRWTRLKTKRPRKALFRSQRGHKTVQLIQLV